MAIVGLKQFHVPTTLIALALLQLSILGVGQKVSKSSRISSDDWHDTNDEAEYSPSDRKAASFSRSHYGPASSNEHATICEEEKNAQVKPRFYLEESSKLIYIDEHNESGYLFGNINSDNDGETHRTAKSTNHSLPSSPQIFDRLHLKNRPKIQHDQSSRPTNYSVFLVSRNREHMAIQIDIEEIDFEPIINCEYQEIRFSIVGEISKQVLNRKEENSTGEVGEDYSSTEDADEAEAASDQKQSSSAAFKTEPVVPPLPVTEAMALLLNSPLNKTILDESDATNDFRIIDSTIDFLHEETCHELEQERKFVSARQEAKKPGSARRPGDSKKNERIAGQKARNSETRKRLGTNSRNKCPIESQQFKEIMSSKLNEFFEWDDFKIACGKIRQLLIPMRSLKLSIYSDEFSPNSRFVIKYKFIKNPNDLPGHDSGKYYCRNRNVVDLSVKCDGVDDCGDASDESIKVCGYPTAGQQTQTTQSQGAASPSNNSLHSSNGSNRKKLTYVNGDVLHCCQSNDWMNLMPANQASQVINLIGESMNLFSAPLFAPTKATSGRRAPGRGRRVKRIVGGSVAQRGAWPGQASLQYELIEPLCHFCAGTLIHPQYVLTAGHCITKDGLNRGIKVVFGAHDLRQLNGNHIQVRYVDDAQIYPGVDVKHLSFDWENDMNNDIALLRLNAPVLVTPNVAPACLPPFNTPLAVNTTCRSIGWGQTHGSGSSNLLKHLTLKVVNSSLCSKELFDRDNDSNNNGADKDQNSPAGKRKSTARSHRGRFASEFETAALDQYSDLTMVCVNNDMGHGICQGDSGGPLYCNRVAQNGEQCTEIYGVASFIIQYATVGAMCAVENLPGIFGEVSSKTEWISSTMKMFEQTYRLKYS